MSPGLEVGLGTSVASMAVAISPVSESLRLSVPWCGSIHSRLILSRLWLPLAVLQEHVDSQDSGVDLQWRRYCVQPPRTVVCVPKQR